MTKIISPMMSYLALIVAFMGRQGPRAEIGTVVATMLPYPIVFLVVWMILLVIFLVFQIPVGPGAPLFLKSTPVRARDLLGPKFLAVVPFSSMSTSTSTSTNGGGRISSDFFATRWV